MRPTLVPMTVMKNAEVSPTIISGAKKEAMRRREKLGHPVTREVLDLERVIRNERGRKNRHESEEQQDRRASGADGRGEGDGGRRPQPAQSTGGRSRSATHSESSDRGRRIEHRSRD